MVRWNGVVAPVALSLITLAGLAAALVGGEPWRPAAWAATALPVAAIAIGLARARRRTRRTPERPDSE